MLSDDTDEEESLNIFMFNFVKTFDPLNEKTPVKHMPEKDYIYDLNRVFIRRRRIAVPKSRQMLCTWWATGCYSWDTYRHFGRFTLYKSIDKLHSGMANKLALLWRSKFIHENLPDIIRPRIKLWKRDNILEFPDNEGHIQAMSMEGEVSRQFTATGCLDDELAVQQYGEAGFGAVMPLLGLTGRYLTLFTYMGPNFACRLSYDKLDE